jgi:hypothetical protein
LALTSSLRAQRSNPFAPYHLSFRDAPLGAGFDVQLHIRESILPIVVMDSGFSPAGCPGMTMMMVMVMDSFSNSPSGKFCGAGNS